MKFSELNEQQWEELGMYLDTCVLPITGLTGLENPVHCVEKLSDLQTLIDSVEKNFRGRVVIYPAYHYISKESTHSVASVISKLKSTGYKHVVVLSTNLDTETMNEFGADLCIASLGIADFEQLIKEHILYLWK